MTVPCAGFCGSVPPAAAPEPPASAGEIQFAGFSAPASFVFTQTADEFDPVTIAAVLDPVSTDFSSPSPGVLRYDGVEVKRFRVSWAMTGLWTAATGGVTVTVFAAALGLNGEVLDESAQGENMNIATMNVFAESASILLELSPGDELQVMMTSTDPGSQYTFAVQGFSLFASEI